MYPGGTVPAGRTKPAGSSHSGSEGGGGSGSSGGSGGGGGSGSGSGSASHGGGAPSGQYRMASADDGRNGTTPATSRPVASAVRTTPRHRRGAMEAFLIGVSGMTSPSRRTHAAGVMRRRPMVQPERTRSSAMEMDRPIGLVRPVRRRREGMPFTVARIGLVNLLLPRGERPLTR